MKLSSLSFVIPTFNDQDTIAEVISNASSVGHLVAKKHEIVVLNDGSTDETAHILKNLAKKTPALRVIEHPFNCGYGETIRDLYYAARNDWIFSVPGDNQIDPGEIEKLIVVAPDADVILGIRVNRNDSFERKIQSRTYNMLMRVLFGVPVDDVNSVRLMRRNVLSAIALTTHSAFVDAELIVRACRNGYRVTGVPIGHKTRQTSGATGGKFTKTILPTIVDMIRFAIGITN